MSRPVVREAIQRLVASGHLDVRQGDGTIVNDVTRTGGLDLLPHLLVDAPEGAGLNRQWCAVCLRCVNTSVRGSPNERRHDQPNRWPNR